MNDDNTPTAPQWAVVELMGHVRYGGQVSKDNQFGTAMLRVDVPRKDGTVISQLINPSSIYRLTFCEEAIAREAATLSEATPISPWELKHLITDKPALPVAQSDHYDYHHDDDHDDDDQF